MMTGLINEGLRKILLILLGTYRTIGISHFGGSCRFEPSCSAYAIEAVQRQTPITALGLIFVRLSRCRPGGGFGYDPVPDRQSKKILSAQDKTRNGVR